MTGADLVRQALRRIGVIPAGQPGSAQQIADGLTIANQMLDAWAADRLAIYETRRALLPLAAETSPYEIGPGGHLDVARPVFCEGVGVVSDVGTPNELERPITLIDSHEAWARVGQKLARGTHPQAVYLDRSFPRRQLYVHPVPVDASYTLALYLPTAMTALSAYVDYTFPPGYWEALSFNLSVRCGLEWGKPASDELRGLAALALGTVFRMNEHPLEMDNEVAMLGRGRGRWTIDGG